MYTHDHDLLNRIERFDVDGRPVQLSFEQRLARECGWSVGFARRVVEEYRRFVYLAMTAGHPVTPSDEVDQAWHLHMTYTSSYWTRLCGQTLPRPLHHNPTAGGAAEAEKFDDWYGRTLASYEAAFGAAPPSDVWPASATRFDPRRQFRRVRTTDYWLIPKFSPRVAALGGGSAAAACIVANTSPPAATGASVAAVVLIIGGAVAVIGLLGLLLHRALSSIAPGRRDTHNGSGCGTYVGGCGGGTSSTHHSGDHGGHGDSGGADGGAHGCSSGCSGGGCGGGGCGGGCGS